MHNALNRKNWIFISFNSVQSIKKGLNEQLSLWKGNREYHSTAPLPPCTHVIPTEWSLLQLVGGGVFSVMGGYRKLNVLKAEYKINWLVSSFYPKTDYVLPFVSAEASILITLLWCCWKSMEKIEDRNDGVLCIHIPPRKTAFQNGAINVHKDIWEEANMRKIIWAQ